MSGTVLLVDDESSVLSALKRALRSEPYEVVSEQSAEAAIERMKSEAFKVVISDERMPGIQGAEFLAIVREQFPATVRILLTGHATLDAAMRAVNEGGIFKFLTKPWDDDVLRQTIRDAVNKYNLERDVWQIFTALRSEEGELELLESDFPGICHLDRDKDGNLLLPELSDDEMELLRRQCEQIFVSQRDQSDAAETVFNILKSQQKEGRV